MVAFSRFRVSDLAAATLGLRPAFAGFRVLGFRASRLWRDQGGGLVFEVVAFSFNLLFWWLGLQSSLCESRQSGTAGTETRIGERTACTPP